MYVLNRLFPMLMALSVGIATSAIVLSATHAHDRRAMLATAPTRQLIAGDGRPPGILGEYAAEISGAPINPALLNRWIAAAPSANHRVRGLTLLRYMGFRDLGAQVNIMIDALQSRDVAGVVERIDGLLAQNAGQAQATDTLSRLERLPELTTAIAGRLDRRPRWRSQYLFDPALLADPEGRRARLRTLAALRPSAETLSAYAFASRESWKNNDFAIAHAFWQRGMAQHQKLALSIKQSSFPFNWRVTTGIDFETTVVSQDDRVSVTIRWNGIGAAAFLVRNRLGPVPVDSELASIVLPVGDSRRITVIYRCQGAGWIAARPLKNGSKWIFQAPRALACAGAEVAIVPATRADSSTTIQFDLFEGHSAEARS